MNEDFKATEMLQEYRQLSTAEQKLEFWNKNLRVNYIEYHESGFDKTDLYSDIGAFEFNVRSEDRDWFANWVVNNYHDLSKSPDKYKNLLVFELLKKTFEQKLSNEVNKLELVKKELYRIKTSFKTTAQSGRTFLSRVAGNVTVINTIYNADYSAFEACKDFNIKVDYNSLFTNLHSVLGVENGYTLGRYWKYLKEIEDSLENQVVCKEATLDQKILILHYLGAFSKINKSVNATKKGVFLEKLIGDDAERIRQRFSSINDLFTPKEKAKKNKLKEDLLEVQEMFKELGLQNIAKNIQSDIRKLD